MKKNILIIVFLIGLLRGGSIVFAFSPGEISGLQLWLDATTGLYTDDSCTTQVQNDSEPVGCWKDRSVNVFTAVQSNASKKPIFISNAGIDLNNKPTLRFGSGGATHLSLGNILNLQYSGFTLFVAGKEKKDINGYCASPYIAKLDYDTIYPGYSLGYDSFQLLLFYRDSSRRSVMANDINNVCGDYEIVASIIDRDEGKVTLWRNGEFKNQGSITTSDISSTLDMIIGNYSDIVEYYLRGDISEILRYDHPLSTGERREIEHYLNEKRFGPISYIQGINARVRINVLTDNYIFSSSWKNMVSRGIPYSAIFNFWNNLGHTTDGDRLETPRHFKFPVPDGIESGNTGRAEMKVKFFTDP